MPFTNFPQGFAAGLSVRGMPLLQSQPGQVFWVDNSPVLNPQQKAGSDGNRGTFLDPFATLNYGISQCVQGRGDIIMVGAGHIETISNATALALSTNGVAIIGLGSGAARPTFVFTTATTANIQLRAANVSIQNCLFLFNFAAIASAFTGTRGSSATSTITGTTFSAVGAVTGSFYPGMTLAGTGVLPGTYIQSQLSGAANGIGTYQVNYSQTVTSTTITGLTPDFAIDNCEFRDLSSVLNAVALVTGTATSNSMDGFSFTNNRISSLGTTAATTAIKMLSATDRMKINNNFGNWAVLNDTAAMLAAGAFNMTNFEFGGNHLQRPNTSSTGGSFISTSGTAWTGHAYDNYLYQLDPTTGIWIATGTGGAFGFSNNFSPITGAVDKSGLINPVAV